MTERPSKEPAHPSALEEVGSAIKREGREFAGEAKSAAQSFASDQRDALADYVAALADAATSGADDLESSGYGRSAATVRRTAEEVGGFAERLQEREPGEIWEDVEDFASMHPALVFGAGFALAFGVTRFLKSGAPQQAEETPESAARATGGASTGAGE